MISLFSLFTIGIGPSSSHTVAPMRAARRFARGLDAAGLLPEVTVVAVDLYGSLAATGVGHGTDRAVRLGLAGEKPDTVDPERMIGDRVPLLGKHIANVSISYHRDRALPTHPNAMTFTAPGEQGILDSVTYYSTGGGFLLDDPVDTTEIPYPFTDAEQLLRMAGDRPISDLVLANEIARGPDVRQRVLHIWDAMRASVHRGLAAEGVLPGGLNVPRRAPALHRRLRGNTEAIDWVALYALAVNEENAAGGRVVTAPTNGAAGIIPAVLHYYHRFVPHAGDEGTIRFLLTAAAIGGIIKRNASISGAEVGCQGEVGSAAAMAAAGLAEVMGGTPGQVENAAEIALEHHLGLTCDPVRGLVQIPCIERNAIAAVKAVTAARLAIQGHGDHLVSLDTAIRTMRDTGADMHTKYKETSNGGLAVNVVEC
jgi:L-serine dehydratase